jgi:hypothetical protein
MIYCLTLNATDKIFLSIWSSVSIAQGTITGAQNRYQSIFNIAGGTHHALNSW